ncbi:MAG: VWA domain-containing protein, partial [Bacteroidota bacterium]|nr:VWA domain-containing protein [Bacteroidota bacterium]
MRHLKLLFFLVFFTTAFSTRAQDNFKYSITIYNERGSVLPDIKVWVTDKLSGQTITKYTGSNGRIDFSLGEGEWTINLIGMPEYKEIKIRPGEVGSGSSSMTYNLKEIQIEQEIIENRPKTNFSEINQEKEKILNPAKGFSVVNIRVKDNSKRALPGIEVGIVSIKQAVIYKSKTDRMGVAKFMVPVGETYAVDVNEIKNYTFTGNIYKEGIITLDLVFVSSQIEETLINDTIRQKVTAATKAATGRVLLELNLNGGTGDKQNVYLQQLFGNKTYHGKTDKNGKVFFLLPGGEKYMVHFDFQPDVDVLNYSKTQGVGNAHVNFTYSPDPRLQFPEKFVPTREDLFIKEFDNFLTKNLPDPLDKKVALYLEWGNENINSESKEAVLKIGVAVSKKNPEAVAPNVDIVFVLDKSGSMDGHDRIDALKKTMVSFTDKLRPGDNVALVTFNEQAYLDLSLAKKEKGVKLKQQINEIQAGGGTNIYKGMLLGY